ncbi:MAG TPA: DUF3089 domain-containing protein [Saprospiraceae bacterium]|nr:DUF3089 domain-containing protein [Saprospiraceae bacterium]
MTRNHFLYFLSAILICTLASCASLSGSRAGDHSPSVPDYTLTQNWAALPMMADSADVIPITSWKDEQTSSHADVFFIHPTTYTGKVKNHQWNADLNDKKLNLSTDKSTIRYQASIFNGAGKVYAPRYRQANLKVFYTLRGTPEAKAVLDIAYEDVRNAFQYYLDHYNQGRPFIIASHSQGSLHASRLISEMIDGKPLQDKMVVAYMPGWPLKNDQFQHITLCKYPDDTGCFCTWRTFKAGYIPPEMHYPDQNIAVTNPVSWSCDQPGCSKDMQIGGVLRNFHTLMPNLVNAEIHEDLLWVNKPVFPGSFLFNRKNYHIADFNFFYADVRKNAQDRVRVYLSTH